MPQTAPALAPCRPYEPAPSPTPQDSSPNSTPTQHPREHRTCPRAPCRQVLSPARKAPQNRTCTSTPKRTPPGSQPSILQNISPSSLEVRTRMVFSYLGNKRPRGQQHIKQQSKTALAPPPQTASPAPAGNLGKTAPTTSPAPQQHPTLPQNSTCIRTPNCMPSISQKCACAITSASIKQHPRAACPLAPTVHQRLKQAPNSTPPPPAPPQPTISQNSTSTSTHMSLAPGRQSRKAAPPIAPPRAVNLAKQPTYMPPSTRPSISQSGTSTSALNWVPPSTRNLAKRHLHQRACPRAPGRQARKPPPALGRQCRKAAPPPAPQAPGSQSRKTAPPPAPHAP